MPLKVYKRGDIWHYRGTVAGRRIRGSTGTSEKATAQRVAAERESQEWKCRLDGPGAVLTFADAAVLYERAEKPTRFVDRLTDHWKDTPVKDITPGAIRQSAITLYPHARAATRNRQCIAPTQAIINHAASMELCQPVRVQRFKVEHVEKKTPATLEWIKAFAAHANPHLGALAWFMFLTGARISEALSVQWEDVDLARARAVIRKTKIGKSRNVHLPATLVAAIANIDGDRSGPVFKYSSRSSAREPWKAAIRRAGIEPLSFHCCRHGFATAMLHAGIDPVTVAKLGGWSDAHHVFKTYGHAMQDDTLADRIIDTPVTQRRARKRAKY